jgi:nicotinate-nucleotide adenylyltransferase
MKAIGIMGGTFNPIHNGHLEIAKAAYEQYGLEEVWFMPNHIPGYKKNEALLNGSLRLDMIKLAIQDYPYFTASDFELQRSGNTYTAETMQLLKKQYPRVQFYFIIGADSLDYFEKWKEPEVILENAFILAAPRDASSTEGMERKMNELHEMFGTGHFGSIACPKVECSSSHIRKQLSKMNLENIDEAQRSELAQKLCIPTKVLHYIKEKHLYQ